MSGLCVSVLGPVRAWNGDHEVDLGTARRRALFAVLAANANRVVSRNELILALWGDSAPTTAAGNVYTYISGLRRSLEPHRAPGSAGGSLLSGPAGYTLRLAPDALDADRFQSLYGAAMGLAAAGRTDDAVAGLDEALGLWHGDAYANLTGRFVELDRYRLGELRIAAAEQRARLILAGGGDDGLVADLTTLVRLSPLHEPFHELLMRALHQAGRSTEALDAFHAARRVLVDELGVEPGPSIRALQSRILAESAEPSAAAAPAPSPHWSPAAAEAPAPPAHVGRDAEVTLLRTLTAAAGAGRGATVWIEGEPGIGKSELLTAVLNEAERIGVRVARGVADELSSRIPLQVMMKALGLETSSDDPERAALAAVLPGDPDGVDRVVAFVREACASGPRVLLVDDMQWVDEAGLRVWERLSELTRTMPLLLVAATRPEPNGRELARLRQGVIDRDGHVLDLGPLHRDDIERILGTAVGADPGPSLRSLAELTAGNPLYARELIAGLLRQEAIVVDGGIAEVAAGMTTMPQSLLDTVQATLDDLSPGSRETLRYAALLGVGFAVADVAAFTGRTPFGVTTDLDEAVAATVVVRTRDGLAFRQPVLRQALVESVPAALRPTLHRHAAEVLAGHGAAAGLIVEHLVRGTPEVDSWLLDWLVGHRAEAVRETPELAGELLRRAVADPRCTPAQRAALTASLTELDQLFGDH
ncbi:BTAD domain-containing putative transcriptional regulator [Actinoplanes rectilineatus]|uniref:BTAD domain-containing putative transcriptional regulator n=1 Tax=Actinoplanes rectilineatus TaxID=113571 RepID=UPI0005F2D17F|nr:BTAD domain-containing putative transcriptional regulator [Actinoplanes rectilineatus]